MDDSQYFDSNIERTMGIITAISNAKASNTPEDMIKAVMPYIAPDIRSRAGIILKALSINRLMQKYSGIAVQAREVKNSRRELMEELKNEMGQRGSNVFDLFIKLYDIREIMEGLQNG